MLHPYHLHKYSILRETDRRRSPSNHLRHPQHNRHVTVSVRIRLDQQTRRGGGFWGDDGYSGCEYLAGCAVVFLGAVVAWCYGAVWAYEVVSGF